MQTAHVPFLIYYISAIMAIWGVCLFWSPNLGVFGPISGANLFIDYGISVRVGGAILVIIAVLCRVGATFHERHPTHAVYLGMMMPQYFTVLFAAMLDLEILITQNYRGREYDFPILLALIGGVPVAAWYHSRAIQERYIIWKALRSRLQA